MRPACWDCGGKLEPVLRPGYQGGGVRGGAPWWRCDCGRLIQAELSDMVDHWAPEVAKRGGAAIIRYSWERPAKASGCAANFDSE